MRNWINLLIGQITEPLWHGVCVCVCQIWLAGGMLADRYHYQKIWHQIRQWLTQDHSPPQQLPRQQTTHSSSRTQWPPHDLIQCFTGHCRRTWQWGLEWSFPMQCLRYRFLWLITCQWCRLTTQPWWCRILYVFISFSSTFSVFSNLC